MASAVAATNKWLLTKRSQCGTERLWDNKLWRESCVRDFRRSLHRTRHRIWDVKTTRAPLLHCKEGVPFKSDKRKEAQDTRRRAVSELRRVQLAQSFQLLSGGWMLNVECMTCMTVGLNVGSMDPPSRAARLHATELRQICAHAMLCTVLYFTAFVCYTKKVKLTGQKYYLILLNQPKYITSYQQNYILWV